MTINTPLYKKLHSIMKHALTHKIASSISLYVGFGDEKSSSDIVMHNGHVKNFHHTKSSDDTIYDLASLTKIIGTTTSIAKAISEGSLFLLEKPFSAWPNVTIRALLAHTSGLPAHQRFYEQLPLNKNNFSQNNVAILENLFSKAPIKETKDRIYSDLGFIALGFLLEQRLKKPLHQIFRDTWHALPLVENFFWFPSRKSHFTNQTLSVVPTGTCKKRQEKIVAQVYDLNCYFMGGLAGHCGLFSTLFSVKNIGNYFLNVAKNPQNELQQNLAHFARYGLGFDKPTAHGTTRVFSPHAFGHFGFTGTSLWIDPAFNNKKGLVIALLTNRVNESVEPEGIFWLRLAINQAIYNAPRAF